MTFNHFSRTNTLRYLVTTALAVTVFSTSAHAEDICRARALIDVPATGRYYELHKGDIVTAITQYWIDPETGERTFCSHGGGCYPERAIVSGRSQIALKLENCVIGPRVDADGLHEIIVDRRRNSAAALRRDDIENQLLEFGMCSACADNAAQHYVTMPSGTCGRLVKSALEGNPQSQAELVDDPEYCRYDYTRRSSKGGQR